MLLLFRVLVLSPVLLAIDDSHPFSVISDE